MFNYDSAVKKGEITHTKVKTAIGELTLVKRNGLLAGVCQEGQKHFPPEIQLGRKVHKNDFIKVISQLDEYFEGLRTSFDLELLLEGTPLQKQVWLAIQNIPYGETSSYAEIANAAGFPKATRAVATAVGLNPITVVIPCHRVVSANGDVKYSASPSNKIKLLEVEAKNAIR